MLHLFNHLRPSARKSGKGFTLIELLIVIAIILILIAIALPNFLEAQQRARVTRAKGNLRSMETAVMSFRTQYGYYYADFNDPSRATMFSRNHKIPSLSPCPINPSGDLPDGGLDWSEMSNSDRFTYYSQGVHCPLTTPIKFIDPGSTVDPWGDGSVPIGMDSRWVGPDSENITAGMKYVAYFVAGPNAIQGEWRRGCEVQNGIGIGCVYNPTNGTKSKGDLWMVLADDTAFAKNEYIPLRTF
jgi:prepilin-type N-terminal cleavage/methylation domain-containing protein